MDLPVITTGRLFTIIDLPPGTLPVFMLGPGLLTVPLKLVHYALERIGVGAP